MMSERVVLRVHVHEGRGFSSDPQALVCSAAYGGITKTTPYSISGDVHSWNTTLAWDVDKEQARKATTCKLSVLRKDGLRLGWVMVDLRAARLQHHHKRNPQGAHVG